MMSTLTYGRSDSEGDAVAAVLDEVDNVAMMETVDINMVDSKDSVSHLETATSLGWGS